MADRNEKSWERAVRPFDFNYAKHMSEADYAACEIPDFLRRDPSDKVLQSRGFRVGYPETRLSET